MAEQVVLIIHGIRDHGTVHDLVIEELKTIGVQGESCQYGRFDLLRFLIPGPWRRRPSRKIARDLVELRRLHPDAEISVIAHSFGTYSVYRALTELSTPTIGHLFLCGGIIPRVADFSMLLKTGRITGQIVNDHSYRDVWPTAAGSLTWGYGNTGTVGFGSPPIIDRWHLGNHGHYFERAFVRGFWKTHFDGTPPPQRNISDTERKCPGWYGLFDIPWRWFLLALAALAIALLVDHEMDPETVERRNYFFSSNRSGVEWAGGDAKQGEVTDAEARRSKGGAPDLLIEDCPGSRARDRNAVLNLVHDLRQAGVWGEVRYKTYKHEEGEDRPDFSGRVSVNIGAHASELTSAEPRQPARSAGRLRGLRGFIVGLGHIPTENLRFYRHTGRSNYHVVLCSEGLFGL